MLGPSSAALTDRADQDQTAKNVPSDPRSALSTTLSYGMVDIR